MRPIATDVARSVVCVYVCVHRTRVSCAKSSQAIEMPFGGADSCGPKEPSPCIRWVKVGRIHSPSQGVTRWRCGLSSTFFHSTLSTVCQPTLLKLSNARNADSKNPLCMSICLNYTRGKAVWDSVY